MSGLQDDRGGGEFEDLEEALRRNRPEASPLKLDEIKRGVRSRARGRAIHAGGLRERVVTALLVAGLAFGGGGALVLAKTGHGGGGKASGGSSGNAAAAQYCPPSSPGAGGPQPCGTPGSPGNPNSPGQGKKKKKYSRKHAARDCRRLTAYRHARRNGRQLSAKQRARMRKLKKNLTSHGYTCRSKGVKHR